MSDDGFHEIQLNGKQLVFLFMAATVVSVVIFLCGVMVGRGVRADRADVSSATSDLAAAASPSPAPVPSSSAASKPSTPSEPPSPTDDAAAIQALQSDHPGDTTLQTPAKSAPSKTSAAVPAPKPAVTEKPAADEKPASPPEHASAPPKPIAEPAAPGTVASGGFAVQITALRDRSEADAIVKRLAGKGYPAYVVNPLPGKPPVYRVQVGRFQDRGEADRIASRLQKEEQFSPWVTR
jgi:cell division septation protein DedD